MKEKQAGNFLIVLAIVFLLGIIGVLAFMLINRQPITSALPLPVPSPTISSLPTASPSPSPTIDESSVLKTLIKKYLIQKHGSSAEALTISVSKIDDIFAKGGASDDGGGGMWFAIKENGNWKLVWDGNGVILCSDLTPYPNFSKTMIPECYDSVKQKNIVR